MASVVDDVLGAVRAGVDAALGLETWQLGSADVAALVEGLAVEASRLSAARLRLLAEADEQRVGAPGGYLSTGGWYAASTRTRVREALPAVRLGTALAGSLAVTGAALAAGALSVEHAAVVHRVVTGLEAALRPPVVPDPEAPGLAAEDALATVAQAESVLVEHATRLDPDQLAVAGRHLVARLTGHTRSARAEQDELQALERAGLSHVQLPDGTWYLRATLDPVGGATLAAALDAASAPQAAGPDGSRDLRTGSQRRAAALAHIADTFLETLPGSTRIRPRVTVTVEARTLVDPWAHGAAPGELTVPGCGDASGGHPLPPTTLETLTCDAELVPVLVSPDGSPLDVGRTVYAFPERIRAAIVARDRGCTFPHGCGRPPAWTQVHHTVPYSQGGRTSERTGVLVCTPAHLLVHRDGWTARVEGDRVVWTPPPRAARRGDRPPGITAPPPWKPDLDRIVEDWRQRLAWRPHHETGPPAADGREHPITGTSARDGGVPP